MPEVVLLFEPPAGPSKTITVRSPQWGNRDELDPTQELFRTLGDRLYVYDRGPERRRLSFRFEMLSAEERADLEDFFGTGQVGFARRWWKLTITPGSREVLRCGALVGGSVPVANGASSYLAGARVLMDSVTHRVRLATPVLDFEEEEDGHFNLDLALEVLAEGEAPTNA